MNGRFLDLGASVCCCGMNVKRLYRKDAKKSFDSLCVLCGSSLRPLRLRGFLSRYCEVTGAFRRLNSPGNCDFVIHNPAATAAAQVMVIRPRALRSATRLLFTSTARATFITQEARNELR